MNEYQPSDHTQQACQQIQQLEDEWKEDPRNLGKIKFAKATIVILKFWEEIATRYPDVWLERFNKHSDEQSQVRELFDLQNLIQYQDFTNHPEMEDYFAQLFVNWAKTIIINGTNDCEHEGLIHQRLTENCLVEAGGEPIIQHWLKRTVEIAEENSLQQQLPLAPTITNNPTSKIKL